MKKASPAVDHAFALYVRLRQVNDQPPSKLKTMKGRALTSRILRHLDSFTIRETDQYYARVVKYRETHG
jgi:hypothetical protein